MSLTEKCTFYPGVQCIIKLDYYTVSAPQKDVPRVPCDGWNMMFNRVDIRVHLMHRAIYMLLKWISHCVTPVNIKLWAARGLLDENAAWKGSLCVAVGAICRKDEIGCWLLRTGGGARKAVNRSVYCTSSPASTPPFICWVFLSCLDHKSKIQDLLHSSWVIQDPWSEMLDLPHFWGWADPRWMSTEYLGHYRNTRPIKGRLWFH